MEKEYNYFEKYAELKMQLKSDLEKITGLEIDEITVIEITKLIRDHDIEISKLQKKIKNNI